MQLPRPFSRRVHGFDPDTVTTISDDEVDPREAGLERADIDAIWSSIRAFYRMRLHPSFSVCIRRRGQVVLKRSVGHARGNRPGPIQERDLVLATPDTPYNLFSASKVVVAMLVHMMDDRGLLHLDDPVEEYIPEFGSFGKHNITIRHVLTHRAGVSSLPSADLSLLTDRERILQIMCDSRIEHRPGRSVAYHAITGGFILDEILRRVSGKDCRQLVDEEFRAPLGLKGFRYGVPADEVETVAEHVFTGPLPRGGTDRTLRKSIGTGVVDAVRISNDPRFLTACIPSANVIATADETTRFFEVLRTGGLTPDGQRIFESRTIRRAVAEQSYHEVDRVMILPVRYSMGFMLGSRRLSFFGQHTQKAFGHLGFTNVLAWTDPERELSVAFMNNGKPFLTPELMLWLNVPRVISARVPRDLQRPRDV